MSEASVNVSITQKNCETCQFEMERMYLIDCLENTYSMT